MTFIEPTNKPPPKREPAFIWTKEREASLREMFRAGFDTKYMAEKLGPGVTYKAVESKFRRMGLNHGRAPQFPWTDESEAHLRQLVDDGLSCRMIAKKMDGGYSRNAIIGKCRRLGLKLFLRPKPPKRAVGQSSVDAGIARRIAARVNIQTMKSDGRADIPTDQSASAISLFDIGADQCRWPLTDAGPGFLFCGTTTQAGRTWCPRHDRLGHYV
jgi:GcrA cell cycle regulator